MAPSNVTSLPPLNLSQHKQETMARKKGLNMKFSRSAHIADCHRPPWNLTLFIQMEATLAYSRPFARRHARTPPPMQPGCLPDSNRRSAAITSCLGLADFKVTRVTPSVRSLRSILLFQLVHFTPRQFHPHEKQIACHKNNNEAHRQINSLSLLEQKSRVWPQLIFWPGGELVLSHIQSLLSI